MTHCHIWKHKSHVPNHQPASITTISLRRNERRTPSISPRISDKRQLVTWELEGWIRPLSKSLGNHKWLSLVKCIGQCGNEQVFSLGDIHLIWLVLPKCFKRPRPSVLWLSLFSNDSLPLNRALKHYFTSTKPGKMYWIIAFWGPIYLWLVVYLPL